MFGLQFVESIQVGFIGRPALTIIKFRSGNTQHAFIAPRENVEKMARDMLYSSDAAAVGEAPAEPK